MYDRFLKVNVTKETLHERDSLPHVDLNLHDSYEPFVYD